MNGGDAKRVCANSTDRTSCVSTTWFSTLEDRREAVARHAGFGPNSWVGRRPAVYGPPRPVRQGGGPRGSRTYPHHKPKKPTTARVRRRLRSASQLLAQRREPNSTTAKTSSTADGDDFVGGTGGDEGAIMTWMAAAVSATQRYIDRIVRQIVAFVE
jgi:hypothetical protein